MELTRVGLHLSWLMRDRIEPVAPPESRPADRRVSLPLFKAIAVNGPDDPKWTQLGWPDSVEKLIASEAQMEEGILVIYYSTAFPKFAAQRHGFENRDTTLANSFAKRYEIWLAVHSLRHYRDRQLAVVENQPLEAVANGPERTQEDPDVAEERETGTVPDSNPFNALCCSRSTTRGTAVRSNHRVTTNSLMMRP